MKKIIALLLAMILCLSFAACGGDEKKETPVETETPEITETNKDTDEKKDDVESEEKDKEEKKEDKKEEIEFEEIVVVDNDDCVIKITGIDPEDSWGYALKVYIENKSEDKTYMYSVQNAAINGVEADPFFATEVAAGKKANDTISFYADDYEAIGIEEFTDIELAFRVYDSNDWSADDVATETIHVYPYGEENATQFVREPEASDTIMVDNDYVTAIITGYEEDDIWGYVANLYVVNKTDKNIMFTVDDVSVNGFMADPFFATEVAAGKCAFNSISWSDDTFEENGITEVEEIEMLFRAYDSDDYSSDDLVNETITLVP